MKAKELLPLIIIVSITLVIGAVLFAAEITPEQTIVNFNPMSEMSIKNDLKVLNTPTPVDNSFIYSQMNLGDTISMMRVSLNIVVRFIPQMG